jgi:hypothetical protein
MLKSADFFQWKVQNLGRKLLKNRRTLGLGEALFEGMTYGRLDDLMTY